VYKQYKRIPVYFFYFRGMGFNRKYRLCFVCVLLVIQFENRSRYCQSPAEYSFDNFPNALRNRYILYSVTHTHDTDT